MKISEIGKMIKHLDAKNFYVICLKQKFRETILPTCDILWYLSILFHFNKIPCSLISWPTNGWEREFENISVAVKRVVGFGEGDHLDCNLCPMLSSCVTLGQLPLCASSSLSVKSDMLVTGPVLQSCEDWVNTCKALGTGPGTLTLINVRFLVHNGHERDLFWKS